MTVPSSDYDYVVVGGGSAGAILAARRAEDPNSRVAVLEPGTPALTRSRPHHRTDEMSVVDPATMRVRGVDGLRVADASVMPGELTANIHPAVIATAERAADLIKKDPS